MGLGVGHLKDDVIKLFELHRLQINSLQTYPPTEVSQLLLSASPDLPSAVPTSPYNTIKMAGAQVVVVYPRNKDSKFDKEYYLSTHMPLVAKHWKKHGLKSYAVTELNADGPYSYSVVMEFESYEGFGAAGADPNTKEVMDDVNNFSNEKPIIVHGSVIGRENV
jgi:uncharacterized protein (TIGR02118 family)